MAPFQNVIKANDILYRLMDALNVRDNVWVKVVWWFATAGSRFLINLEFSVNGRVN